jgi:putative flippase GtrA
MTMVMSLYRRWRMLVHELTKFGIVGAFNTALDFGVANFLHVGLHTNQYLAKTVSVTIAATSSYFMNRYWTFRHRARTGIGREYALFFVLNGIGLVIALACIWLVTGPLGRTGVLWFNVAQVLGLLLGMLFRFTTYKRWVFLARPETGEGPAPEEPQPAAWSRTRA